MYNLGFSIGGKYINDYEDKLENSTAKLERGFDFFVKLENEFIFDRVTVGLDLFYTMHDDLKSKNLRPVGEYSEFKFDSYDEYGFNIDANYALTEDNYIGVYFDMTFSDLKNKTQIPDTEDHYKDPTEYKFGVKYTTQF